MPRSSRCAAVCFASPLTAAKIKGNNQQITLHAFFILCWLSCLCWVVVGLMLYYLPQRLAPLTGQ